MNSLKLKPETQRLAVDFYQGQKQSIKQICDMVGISKPTLYKYVAGNSGIHLKTRNIRKKAVQKDFEEVP